MSITQCYECQEPIHSLTKEEGMFIYHSIFMFVVGCEGVIDMHSLVGECRQIG